MSEKLIKGIYAAILAPRAPEGDVDEAAMVRQFEFLLSRGVRNFAVNGATGEYCLSSLADLKQTLGVAKRTLSAEATFLCGIGSAGLGDTLELGNAATEAGAIGVLLPVPYFFPYAQDDASEFVRSVAARVPAPILLYNLPQFTTGFDASTAMELIRECGNVIGIKDSSGSLDILRALTRERIEASRIMGNDGVLPQALTEGICDGVVSGIACVLPEVIERLFASQPGTATFQTTVALLNEFIAQIDMLPFPWGLKAISEARGIGKATYPLPVSARRAKQIGEIQEWFKEWLPRFEATEWEVRAERP